MSISKLNADKLTEYLNDGNYIVNGVNISNFVGVTQLSVKLQAKNGGNTIEVYVLGEPGVDIAALYKAVQERI